MDRIAVLDDWQDVADRVFDWSEVRRRAELVFFREPFANQDEMANALIDFDAIVAMRERSRFSAEMISRLPRLRLLTFTGARNAAVDIEACTASGILVCNTQQPGRRSNATAELALELIISIARQIPLADRAMKDGRFQESVPLGMELQGRVLGILGLGNIGSTLALYGKALGMKVIAWSQNLTDERAAAAGALRVSKEDLFSRADVVTLHAVLSERSRNIVGAAEIGLMKPNAMLINTSRSALIDQAALLQALNGKRIFAGLDVYDLEPLEPAHPLRTAPNTILTPHIGYGTVEVLSDFYRQCAENLVAWMDKRPIRVVNPTATVRV